MRSVDGKIPFGTAILKFDHLIAARRGDLIRHGNCVRGAEIGVGEGVEMDQMVDGMNEVLRVACEKVRGLLHRATADDVTARHQAGAIIAEVKRSKGTYGTRAVAQLAEALGQDEQTLYRYATVAERWSAEEVDALLKRTTRHGEPLCWSHLVLLADVPSARRRTELVDRCLADALSVRELARLIAEGPGNTPSRGVAPVLEGLVRRTDRYSQAISGLHEDLLAELERAGTQADVQALLERAIESQQRLAAIVEQQVEHLKARRARLGAERKRGARERVPRLLAGMTGET